MDFMPHFFGLEFANLYLQFKRRPFAVHKAILVYDIISTGSLIYTYRRRCTSQRLLSFHTRVQHLSHPAADGASSTASVCQRLGRLSDYGFIP